MARRPKALVQRLELPWSPTALTKSEVYAVRALFKGEATDVQQKTIVDFLAKVCGGKELEFRAEGERASAFASGKRFVWLELVKLSALPGSFIQTLE